MNRYNFSRAEIKRAISGDANDIPNFMKKYAFEVKGDKLFFEGREVSASIWNICPHRDVVSALSDLPDSDIVREHDDPCRCA